MVKVVFIVLISFFLVILFMSLPYNGESSRIYVLWKKIYQWGFAKYLGWLERKAARKESRRIKEKAKIKGMKHV